MIGSAFDFKVNSLVQHILSTRNRARNRIWCSVYFAKVEIGKQDDNLPRLNNMPGIFHVYVYKLQGHHEIAMTDYLF